VDISNVTNTSPLPGSVANQPAAGTSSLAAAEQSPAVQALSLFKNAESVLFSSLGGGGSTLPDLSGLTATAQAYSLYTNPGLLQQLATSSALGTTVDATA
jgi:hypothetical protein